MASKKKSRRELARNLLDISVSVKEAATGLLEEGSEALSLTSSELFLTEWIWYRKWTLLKILGPSNLMERADRLRKKAFSSSSSSAISSSSGKKTSVGRMMVCQVFR